MISDAVLGETSEPLTEHPFIVSEGAHVPYVAKNILWEQMSFHRFKTKLNEILKEVDAQKLLDKKELTYWAFYGFLCGQNNAFEDAIQKGLCLNYEAMNDRIATIYQDGQYKLDDALINDIESLHEICNLKLIESKLLSMYANEINKQESNGDISIVQSIATATNFIYAMYPTNIPMYTNTMMGLRYDTFFVEEEKGIFSKKVTPLTKEDALVKYLRLPMQLMNEIEEVASANEQNIEKLDEFKAQIEEFVVALEDSNTEIADQTKAAFDTALSSNESQEYVAKKDKDKDDFSIC